MKTINIKGKPYVEVKERVGWLRDNEKGNYSITTKYNYVPEEDRKMWIVKATLKIGDQVFTGHAQEIETKEYNKVNTTSALENAETSAIGRACAAAGIGIQDSMASADEIVKAENRSNSAKGKKYPYPLIQETDWTKRNMKANITVFKEKGFDIIQIGEKKMVGNAKWVKYVKGQVKASEAA